MKAGIGVMIGYLGGNEETVNTIKSSIGKTIKEVSLVENELLFKFTDDTGMRIFDDGQSCCEYRYMVSDDDLTYFAGTVFKNIEIKSAENASEEYGEHEIQFLEIATDKGSFTMANHNEHNGYYGGFWIVAKPL